MNVLVFTDADADGGVGVIVPVGVETAADLIAQVPAGAAHAIVDPADLPARADRHGWVLLDGAVVVDQARVAGPAPDTAPAWKCKVVLAQQPAQGAGPTLLDDIAAWVATQDRASQIAFKEASEWSRIGAFMAAAQAQFSITDAQRDAWFIAADQVTV